MKLSFGNYSYYDPDDNTAVSTGNEANKYKFDNNHFQQLIAQREYEAAANYASKYHFDDPATQRAHENDIINLRREGRKIAAIYSQVPDEKTKDKMEFIDNLFVDGGLEQIINNPYAERFVKLKRMLGSDLSTNFAGAATFDSSLIEGIARVGNDSEILKEATGLEITFNPRKQTGIFGWDWIARDNYNDVTAFYEKSGLNEVALKSAGVEVTNKDGKTSLKFDKSNRLANQIIANLFFIDTDDGLNITNIPQNVDIKGITSDGTYIQQDITGRGLTKSANVNDILRLVKQAEEAKKSMFQTIDATEKDYSSTVGPSLDDNLEALNQMLSSGQITQQQYNQQIKQVGSILDQAVRTLGSGNYEMFSNAYNDEPTDETMVSLDNIQRSEIIQSISAADPKNLHFNAMISNGQVGTLITIDADELDDKDISDDDDRNEVKRRRRQVFIPGFMSEIAQKKINQNTSSRAIQEINSMQDYGYGFKTSDGIEIYSSMDGRFYAGGQEISKEEATKAINKTLIIEDATANLKYQFTNNNVELYDREGYEKIAKAIAVRAANELHPEIPFEDNITVDDIFAKKGAGPEVQYKYSRQMQYQLYNKYKDVFEIYDAIMTPIMTNNK